MINNKLIHSKTIAVIMTVHNRKEKTISCLSYLFQNKSTDFLIDIYITDDGCTDGTKEAVSERYPDVTIIQGDGSLFWNRGMRLAWAYASKEDPDYYLWLNDDTELMPDALSRLLNSSLRMEDKSIIVGSTYISSKDKKLSYGGRLKKHNNPVVEPDNTECVQCDTFNGNVVLIPRSVFEKLGYNDNYYHHSFGDFDYGIVAGLKGVRSYIAPGYYGYCGRNNPIPQFRRKCYSVIKRYKLLYSPLGYNPFEDFHLNRKYQPLLLCVWYFIKLHINVLFAVDHTKDEK